MASYFVKAISGDGEAIEEYREASDEATVIQSLQDEGYIPIQVLPAAKKSFSWLRSGRRDKPSINQKEVGLFTRELATLLNAGLPLDRSLTVLMRLSPEDSPLYILVNEVLEKVKGGANLSDALEAQKGVFSRFYLNMIRAGEAGGGLEPVLERLSNHLENAKELKETVSTAMIYPIILVVIAVSSVALLLTFVVPQFTEMFEDAGKELPLPTQVVVALSDGLANYWWVLLLGGTILFSYMRTQLADPDRRYVWDKRFLRLPLVGDLISKVQVASLSQTLATLLSNGVPLLAALSIAKETLTNRVMAEKIGFSADSLKEGRDMSGPLIESGLFPDMALQMIKLGEESGHLEEMLERVASTYEKEIKTAIQRLLAILEPLLIVGLGIMIAGIIISILMAILSVNDLAF